TSHPSRNEEGHDRDQAENQSARGHAQRVFEDRFESAIVMAASLAKHFIQESAEVELLTLREDERVESGKGLDHLHKILRVLATLEPDAEVDPDKHDKSGHRSPRGHKRRSGAERRKELDPSGEDRVLASIENQSATNLWQMMEQMPMLADERRFK